MHEDPPTGGARPDGASTLDLSGRCVGNSYILVRPIGQGATGTVWRGVDRASGEQVAVKLLHESLLRQPKLVTRFVQERTILLMLRHRNVVRVRDLFSVGESLGLVMDLVAGGSLREHLREQHTVPPAQAARLAAQVAAALAEAHDLGVVHRDLKPDNILLHTEDGQLDTRLTDFGIARVLNTPSLTTPHAVVGTPHYMAPEAFHGAPTSPAADVYALGVLLYELVVGRPPYDSESVGDLMRQHLEERPERRPGIPDCLWAVITDCMERKPRLRPTAAELVADLTAVARETTEVPALSRPRGTAPVPRKPTAGAAWSADPVAPGTIPEHAGSAEPDRPAEPASSGGSAGPGSAGPGEVAGPAGSGEVAGSAGSGEVAGSAGSGEVAGSAGPGEVSRPAGTASVGDPVGAGSADGVAAPNHPSLSGGMRRIPRRRNEVPRWRWARPGAMVALVCGAMLGSGVTTGAWHASRADGPDGTEVRVLASGTPAPSASGLPVVSPSGTKSTGAPSTDPPAPPSVRPPDQTADDSSANGGVRGDVSAGAGRAVATVRPVGRRADAGTGRVPEVKPYGPWQCERRFQFTRNTPMLAEPCHSLGPAIRMVGQLAAPAGGDAMVTVTLQDTANGHVVAGPHTCARLVFTDRRLSNRCERSVAAVPRGHRYAVTVSWRYTQRGETVQGTARGPEFRW